MAKTFQEDQTCPQQELQTSFEKDENSYVLKATPVKTANKHTARMRFGSDSKKVLLKQIRKRTQGSRTKRKSPKRLRQHFDVAKRKIETAADTMQKTPDQYLLAHSISQLKSSSKVYGLPIRQKVAQGPKANSQTKANSRPIKSALKEGNKGSVQNKAKKMLNKAKVMFKTKTNRNNFVIELEGYPTPFQVMKRPTVRQRNTCSAVINCSSDSDNENIPLNKLKQIMKSRNTNNKLSKSPVIKQRKKAVVASEQKPAAKKRENKSTKLKAGKNAESSSPGKGTVTPEKQTVLRCLKPYVQVIDISPLIDRTKVSQTSLASEGTGFSADSSEHEFSTQLGENGDTVEECDDYELVEMMERTDVLDRCSRSTSPSEKVAIFNHRIGRYVYVPKDHPCLHSPPLPKVEELDIPDAIRENTLYQKARESEKKDYERGSEMVLNYGFQWMKLPVGGPRYPASSLRHLAKMNRTTTEYWRQMHTPAARYADAKRKLFRKRKSTSTVTRANSRRKQNVSRKFKGIRMWSRNSLAERHIFI